MKGKVCQWQDEKGFGFIQPENGSEKLFFHISSVKTTARRPEVGDSVLYDSTRDSQNRLRAKGVVIDGVSRTGGASAKSRHSKIEPPRKNAIDYVSILIILGSLITLGFVFYHTNSIEISWIYSAPAVLGFFILNRQRKPIEKSFTCARCGGAVSEFDQRTIQAWNSGFLKLYCRSCHRQWLDNNPRQEKVQVRSNNGGCLGVLAVMILIPSIGGVGLYQWLM
jgi:cold shock CspA family protein